MLRIIILLSSVLLPISVFATAQAPDYLIYKEERHRLHVNPLEELFLMKKELRPKGGVMSTGNWRGYVATFEIKQGFLTVSDITIEKRDPDKDKEHNYLTESVLKKVFPNQSARKMDWFSGLLVVPLGKRTGYVHLSYASRYENYLVIRIKSGRIVESAQMNSDEYLDFKTRQFKVFKSTSEYKALYEELSKDGGSEDEFDLESFIFQMGGFTHKVDVPFESPNK
ncbi:hypothetical protein [Microbulbifer sp. TRSA005]|uniref:hypothetical protein n=1 Tax=unclassified Microbulbifer TaxID=2619833 RepID=UPI00403980BB